LAIIAVVVGVSLVDLPRSYGVGTQAAMALTRPLAPSVDVTAESGATVAGRLTSWREPIGSGVVEHLAGRTSTGDLLVFSWSSAAPHWSASNVSAATGTKIAGPVAVWQSAVAGETTEHLVAPGLAGQLLVFTKSATAWNVTDVTSAVGVKVAGPVVTWTSSGPTGDIGYVAARDMGGDLQVFTDRPGKGWAATDVSSTTGITVLSVSASWATFNASGELVAHVAATASDGRLALFTYTAGGAWEVQVLDERFPSGAVAWTTGPVEHLAAARADGTVVVLWRSGTFDWHTVDVTSITGERGSGRPAYYTLRDGSEHVDVLAMRSSTGHIVQFWWKPSRDWQALDLTAISGVSATADLEAWLTTSGSRVIEHLATVRPDGHISIVYSYDQPRTLTDSVGDSYRSIQRMRGVSRNVLVVLWDPHNPTVTGRPSSYTIDQTVFGDTRSVRDFFVRNSGGAFTINRVGVLGWYDADHPASWYDDPAHPHDKMAAALRSADPDFDYRRYDTNHNGTVEPTELAIVFAHPSNSPGGLNRTFGREIHDLDGGALTLDGVRIREGVELGIGTPANLGVVAHELSHLLLGAGDMYFNFFTPTAAGSYSLMDQHAPGHFLDPFHRLKLGWIQPRLVFRSGQYSVPDVETRHQALILVDPDRGTDEYFIVENRWPATSYDAGLADTGLAVWHVMENSSVYNSAPPPTTVSPSNWATIASDDWGRKAIRMVRPILTPPFSDASALWDGSDPLTGYDLLSSDPDPNHSTLRWGDGTPSGFALRDIGPPGSNVGVLVSTP